VRHLPCKVQRIREGGHGESYDILLMQLFAMPFKREEDFQFLFEIRAFPILLRRRMYRILPPFGDGAGATSKSTPEENATPRPKHQDGHRNRAPTDASLASSVAAGIIMRTLALASVTFEAKPKPGPGTRCCISGRQY
jgi:hypothetical protein